MVNRDLQATRRGLPYRRRLALAWSELSKFAKSSGWPSPAGLARIANRLLVAFVQQQFDLGRNIGTARHAVLSVQYAHRSLKGHLREAWDSLESWQQEAECGTRTEPP